MSSTTESSVPPIVSASEQQRAQVIEPTSAASHPTPVDKAPTSPVDVKKIPADQIKKPSEVNRDDPNINVVELPPKSPTFKEQVYGYARVIRGTVSCDVDVSWRMNLMRLSREMLAKPGVKEQGEQVLRGEQPIPERRGS
ncbi:hypothetical protein PAXRUDRAFT_829478 [Paxillus rubicundulus Ve08.2h10]|uniref:Uncharacterized protein n=1 Tax=Paxillus rubicundulus Ve08.2h10 TaxID=930991 RepID=A0A0D0DMT0_9AGAM|nr:hypothetical protein PAXRUDRAFT_829478 [Paxillus rubicundulus Ve08.2h10]